MNQVVEFKTGYKDDILRFANLGIVLCKHPNFNLSNEIGIFVGGSKILKSNYKFYISLDKKKVPTGAICIDNDGEVLLFAVEKTNFEDSTKFLIGKCDELLETKKFDKISARVNPKYILKFNDDGFKTIRFFEGDTSEYKFLVQKTR